MEASAWRMPTEAELDWMTAVSAVPASTPRIGLRNRRKKFWKPGTSRSPSTAPAMVSMPNISVANPSRIMPVSFFLSFFKNR